MEVSDDVDLRAWKIARDYSIKDKVEKISNMFELKDEKFETGIGSMG